MKAISWASGVELNYTKIGNVFYYVYKRFFKFLSRFFTFNVFLFSFERFFASMVSSFVFTVMYDGDVDFRRNFGIFLRTLLQCT